MNRRLFVESLIGGALAAHQLDIEKLLWVPGQKTIFIPPPVTEVNVEDLVALMIAAHRKVEEAVAIGRLGTPPQLFLSRRSFERFKHHFGPGFPRHVTIVE